MGDIQVWFFVFDGANDAGLPIGPLHKADGGLLADLRAPSVGSHHQTGRNRLAVADFRCDAALRTVQAQ